MHLCAIAYEAGLDPKKIFAVIDALSERVPLVAKVNPAAQYDMAVSYTHLDVYKRQPDTFSGKAGKQRIGDDIPKGYSLGDWAIKLAVERLSLIHI